ncbi:MAG: hypothetical protein L6R41_001328 [Letrouitia leprolyta]|nr:MAG: hypothetical protein L6R41_001328 [Letrouitia leprolyta]
MNADCFYLTLLAFRNLFDISIRKKSFKWAYCLELPPSNRPFNRQIFLLLLPKEPMLVPPTMPSAHLQSPPSSPSTRTARPSTPTSSAPQQQQRRQRKRAHYTLSASRTTREDASRGVLEPRPVEDAMVMGIGEGRIESLRLAGFLSGLVRA